jgi:UrcA family protein
MPVRNNFQLIYPRNPGFFKTGTAPAILLDVPAIRPVRTEEGGHIMQTIRSIAIIGAVVAGAASFVAPANANVPTDVMQTRVAYGDLNLNSVDGQKTLARRIQHAATQVCGPDEASNRFQVAACRAKAVDGATAEARKAGATAL